MHSVLQNDWDNIGEVLEQTLDVAKEHFKKQSDLAPGRFVNDITLQNLPEKGMGAKSVIEYFAINYAPQLTHSAGPRYFGFVTGGSTPAAVVGDQLVSVYDQNACGSNDSIAPQLERQTIHFFKQLFGLDKQFFGSFVTGATVSNFTSLAIARQWAGEQLNIDVSNEGASSVPMHILSATAHSSIFKSLSMLGIGRKNIVKINTLPGREAIDINDLENYLEHNSKNPIILLANAGTVNTVDFDDLQAIGELKINTISGCM